MMRRPPRSTLSSSSAASDVYKRQVSADERGDYQGSLEAFEAAYKFNPTAFNQVNVAVCLMRFAIRGEGVQYLRRALDQMWEAKQAGAKHAQDNWNVLLETCGHMDYPIPPQYTEQKPLRWHRPELLHQRDVPPAPPLPRVELSELGSVGLEDYFQRKQPFVLTGAMEGWQALSWDLNQLAARWPKAVADFHPFNMLARDSKALYLTRFGAGLRQLAVHKTVFDEQGSGPEGRYLHVQFTPDMWESLEQQGHVPGSRHAHMKGDQWMDSCLSPELQQEFHLKTHWKILIIGTRGAGMFNHTDSLRTSSWHAQLSGRKWWYVCRGGKCYETVTEPGEMLYYGDQWWHETENLDPLTSTVTGTVIHKNNWRATSERLFQECVGDELGFSFSAQLCDALDTCRVHWHSEWTQEKQPSLRGWREAATAQVINKRESVAPTENNYDGSNYILES
eukprot:TRINITY_DN11631_c0_g1_i6.p1 TRINITY_DN11631_c0_g1~~TRINITY_DN11631_c0_g1_i6.p1  ORF type:complete len:449 (-),score=119.77 TRINITY_DN11631_c0_g1_i6:21-1367(-)